MISETLLPEFDHEIATTRSLLERVPSDKAGFKPHQKSSSLGDLAMHVANIPGYAMLAMTGTEVDATKLPKGTFSSTEELLRHFDSGVARAREAIAKTSDEDFMKSWTLRSGDHVVMTLPRIGAYRTVVMNHMIHHRGQLTVYLRLNDVPLPSVYGPTADMAM